MYASADTVDPMTWTEYVRQVAPAEPNAAIAERIGITGASVGRWFSKGSLPDPATAATFARVYGRPVLEAFIAAGYLSPSEAAQQPMAPPSLATLADDDLIEEVRRRMTGGTTDVGSTEAQKSSDRRSTGGAVVVPFSREDLARQGLAASQGDGVDYDTPDA